MDEVSAVKKRKEEQKKIIDKDKKKHKKSWKNKIVKRDWRVRSSDGSSISVYVSVPAAGDIKYSLSSSTNVGNFRRDIKPDIGYFAHQYKLTFNGAALEDTRTFEEQGVTNKSKLSIVLHSGMDGYGYKKETIVI